MKSHPVSVFGFAASETLVLAASSNGLLASVDAGAPWEPVGDASLPVHAVLTLAEQTSLEVIVTGGPAGVRRSEDRGISWSTTLTGSPITTLAGSRDRSAAGVVLAGTEADGVFRSEDGGVHWASASAGLFDLEALTVALSPAFAFDNTAFLGSATGLYRSRNGGRAWRSLQLPGAESAVQCLAIAPDFKETGALLAGTENDGLVRSDDGGASWARVELFDHSGVDALLWSHANPSLLLAAAADGIGRSVDGGDAWTLMDTPAPVIALAEAVTSAGAVFLAGLFDGGILRSTDGAVTWQPVDIQPAKERV
jgi:photosystem II stability/assembly factor-like uncharacterized protein